MAVWDDVISERDRQVFAAAGWGRPAGFGRRPVVLVIDVIYSFCGDQPEPILESIKKYRYSCGEVAWDGVAAIRRLLDVARARNVPVVYTNQEYRSDKFDMGGGWYRKSRRSDDPVDVQGHKGNDIVAEIAPQWPDIVFDKKKPSCFHGTPLLGYLIDLGADTLIITGTTTSGCVRATTVDGASYNYFCAIPEECVWDRGELTHKVNLFDLQMKYADVTPLDSVIDYLNGLPAGLYAGQWPPGR